MSFFKMKGTHKFSVFRGQVQNKLIETGAITIEFSFSLVCFDISFYSEKQKHKSFEKKNQTFLVAPKNVAFISVHADIS